MRKNIFKTISIVASIMIAVGANAQAPTWTWIGHGSTVGGTAVQADHIKVDAAGNSYVAVRHDAKIGIQKYSPGGTMIWHTYSVEGIATNSIADLVIDSEGNSYIVGTFYDTCTFGSTTLIAESGSAAYFAKIDSAGNQIWITQSEEYAVGTAIAVSTTGDIIVGGYTQGDPGTPFSIGSVTLTRPNSMKHYFLAKLDASGTAQWIKMYETAYPNIYTRTWIKGLAVDASGNIYGTGLVNTGSSGSLDFGGVSLPSNGSGSGESAITFKADNNGNIIWVKQSSNSNLSENISGYGIGLDDSGNVYSFGWVRDSLMFGSFTVSTNASQYLYGESDLYVVKYDNSGNELWAKTIVPAQVDKNSILYNKMGMTVSNDGDIYLTGTCKPYGIPTIDFGNGVTVSTSPTSNNLYVIKLNTNGIAQWAKWTSPSFSFDNFYDVDIDPAGNCYVAGYWITGTGFDGLPAPTGDKIFVLKLGNSTLSGIMDLSNNAFQFDVYPNPAQENVTISNIPSSSTVKITDITGKVVYNAVIKNEQTTINTTDFVNGIYILQVSNNGSIATKKLVVNK